MTARILLVTGSRVLEDCEQRATAYSLFRAFVVVSAPTIIVCGDATGPDRWALYIADERDLTLRVYALDGWVYDRELQRQRRWHLDKTTTTSPLDRNAAMVRETAAQRAKGAHVEALGLEAAWSTTHGTAHTLSKARAAGLPITRITFERGAT